MSGDPDTTGRIAIARTVHEAIRAWSAAHGQGDIPHWNKAPKWMHASTLESVAHVIEHPDAPNSAQHDQWMAQKREAGWVFGETKSAEAKTHPMLVPYEELPVFERRKDALVRAIVHALTGPDDA